MLGFAPPTAWADESFQPATLMQWGYGDGGQGGPDRDAPIVTDRPDFTEASSTVGRGVAQLEAGYTYFIDDGPTGSVVAHSFPETLLRVGVLAEWLELRAAWNYGVENAGGVSNDGANDLYLGVKLGLTGQVGLLPEMAILPQATVPTGANAFSAGEFLPGVNWLYGWEVTEIISAGGSTQYNRRVDDATGDAYTQWAQSLTANYALAEKVGAYTEWFALFPHSADTALTEHYLDGGFTYRPTNNLQFDIRAGVGLNDAANDLFTGAGVSIRR